AVRDFADIAIVSAANRDAVEEEWERFGLLPLVDVMMCQDVGSKAHCISVMLEKGYAPDHVLMCGDAPGDRDAAEKNGVFFYPVLVRHEKESWQEFPSAARHLADGSYGAYGEQKMKEFVENLTHG
ncbi:MAG: HAD hydrolase-like protein, partial [Parasporobacterium sp.]|nr:HAD hydrolase-like protein [Parasporobacterium sp.]